MQRKDGSRRSQTHSVVFGIRVNDIQLHFSDLDIAGSINLQNEDFCKQQTHSWQLKCALLVHLVLLQKGRYCTKKLENSDMILNRSEVIYKQLVKSCVPLIDKRRQLICLIPLSSIQLSNLISRGNQSIFSKVVAKQCFGGEVAFCRFA